MHATNQANALRWLLALSTAQVVGAALTLAGGYAASVAVPHDFPPWPLMLFTGTLEGCVFGGFQAWALRDARRAAWSMRTALAFGATWMGAALISMAGVEPTSAGGRIALASILGAALGVVIAACQRALLPERVRWTSWLLASAIGWAAGLPLGAIISDLVPPGDLVISSIFIQLAGGGVTGGTVAAAMLTQAREVGASA